MKAHILNLAATIILLLCYGCANYNPSKAIYEGVQTHEQLQSTPSERFGKPEPLNYERYESERKH